MFAKINDLIIKEEASRNQKKLVTLLDAKPQSIFSENIKLYLNKMIHHILLVSYNGVLYFIQKDGNCIIKPFHFLDDVN